MECVLDQRKDHFFLEGAIGDHVARTANDGDLIVSQSRIFSLTDFSFCAAISFIFLTLLPSQSFADEQRRTRSTSASRTLPKTEIITSNCDRKPGRSINDVACEFHSVGEESFGDALRFARSEKSVAIFYDPRIFDPVEIESFAHLIRSRVGVDVRVFRHGQNTEIDNMMRICIGNTYYMLNKDQFDEPKYIYEAYSSFDILKQKGMLKYHQYKESADPLIISAQSDGELVEYGNLKKTRQELANILNDMVLSVEKEMAARHILFKLDKSDPNGLSDNRKTFMEVSLREYSVKQ